MDNNNAWKLKKSGDRLDGGDSGDRAQPNRFYRGAILRALHGRITGHTGRHEWRPYKPTIMLNNPVAEDTSPFYE